MYKTTIYKRSHSPDGLQSSVFKAIRNRESIMNRDENELPPMQCTLAKMGDGEPEITDLRLFASNLNEQQKAMRMLQERNDEPSSTFPYLAESLDDSTLTVQWIRSCSTGDLRAVGQLIKQKPNLVSYAPAINHGLSGLHYAAKGGHSTVLRLLISNGANVNLQTASGYTPLHFAAIGHQFDIISILLRDYDADSSIVDYSGHTYQHYLTKTPGKDFSSGNDGNLIRSNRIESQNVSSIDSTQFSRLKSFRKVVHGKMRFFDK